MVFVDDITAFVRRRNKVVAEMAKKVMKRVREEVEKKGHKLSANENGKEGKSKMIASCGFLKEELRQCSTEEGVTMADSVETLGVDLRKQESKGWGQKKNEEEEVQGEILDHQEEQGLPKELHEGGGQEVVTNGYGASKDVESARSRDGSHGKVEIEEADGSSSGYKEYNFVVRVHVEPLALKWKKSSLLRLLRLGQNERGLANGTMNKKKLG